VNSLMGCLGLENKRRRWATAIKYVEADPNFEDVALRACSQLTIKTSCN
jgi:hypothetical protein